MEDQLSQQSSFGKLKLYINSLTKKQKYTLSLGAVFLLYMLYTFFHLPPKDFPIGQVITVQSGESLQSITNDLYKNNVIRFPFVFRSTVILLGGEKNVIAGDYLMDKREGPAGIAHRMVKGKFHLDTIKITIPEGWNIFQIGDYLEKNLIKFDKASFVVQAKTKEGYLFPDTYFISPAERPEALIKRMNDNFNDRITEISGVATSTRKLKEIMIMASILEAEARTMESRRTIAGILWKRLSIGMPLQVDSTFLYINGKNTYDLTLDDLQIDSPYNTYKYRGLPPGPIGNPGEGAIIATLNPINTKYLYFLSSKSGDMYYAKTFEEHIRNKELYLNK